MRVHERVSELVGECANGEREGEGGEEDRDRDR